MAQADRLFVNLTEQAARPRPVPGSELVPAPVRKAETGASEVPQPVASGHRGPDQAEVLEMVHGAINAINERLASLERSLAPDGHLHAQLAQRALEQLDDLRRPASSPSPVDDGPESDDLTTKEEVEACSGGLPVLGLIPHVGPRSGRPDDLSQVAGEERRSAESYRALRTSVLFLGVDRQVRTIQVTSPLLGDGKSTVAGNLAIALARTGTRVIALTADLRRPRLHEFFGLPNEKGFTSVLNRVVPLQQVIQQVPGIPGLKLVASGPTCSNPSELLLSRRAAEIIRVLEDQCDVLLIDCPPVLPVTDAVALSQQVQATILVVKAGMTSRRDLQRTVEILRQVDAPLLGTVVNDISSHHSGYGLGFGARYDYDSVTRPDQSGSQDHAGADRRS